MESNTIIFMVTTFDINKLVLGKLCRRNHEYENTKMSLRYKNKRGSCVECRRITSAKEKAKRKNKKSNLTDQQKQILIEQGKNPDLYRLGSLCKHSHNWNDTGKSLRMISNGTCEGCYTITNAKSYTKHIDRHRQRGRDRYANDPVHRERTKKRAKKWWYENHKYALEQNKKRRDNRSPEQIKRDDEAKERYYQLNWEACQWRGRNQILDERFGNRRIPYSQQDLLDRLADFNGQCAYCACNFNTKEFQVTDSLTWDHVVPRTKNGWDCLLNLVPACRSCNASKSNKDMETWYTQQEFFSYADLEYIKSVTLIKE